jgi:hypothetical protein
VRPLLDLKAHGYLSLARQNPWLLRCDAKVRNYVRYRLTPRRERIAPRSAGPVFLTLSITRRCNLTCRFCIVGDVINKGWRETEATLEGVARVMDHPVTRRCLYVMLTGGEPLLHDDAVAIVGLLKSRRHLVGISTNGLHLAERAEALRAAGLDVANVSLYDENRDDLAGALPRVVPRLYCKLTKVIGRRDVEEPGRLDDAVRFARDTGCGRIFFQNVYPHVDGLAKRHGPPASRTPVEPSARPSATSSPRSTRRCNATSRVATRPCACSGPRPSPSGTRSPGRRAACRGTS